MKKIILAVLLMLLAVVSSNAIAEWVKVTPDTDNNTQISYADPATIRKKGNMVKMWGLIDYKAARIDFTGMTYMSLQEQSEYDCEEDQVRILYFSFHSENMGRGKLLFSNSDPQKWQPAPPGSPADEMWKIACGKRK
jgi:hypothetical protein